MEFEIRKITIKDIQFGENTTVKEGVLTVNKKELVDHLLKEEKIKSVDVHIARPGDSIRILPVKDVVEPRAKLEGDCFPGVDGELAEVGRGVTYALKECAVTTTGPIVGFQEGVLDMTGPLADYSPLAHINHVVLEIEKKDHVDQHEHEKIIREAGIKAAHYIGKQAVGTPHDSVEHHSWKSISDRVNAYPDLPKVAYVCQVMSQGLLHDTYFYGKDSKKMLPTLVTPFEGMDGAIVSGNCVSPGSKTTTYHHQNNAVVKECLKRHGKEINFVGMIISPLMATLDDKFRNSTLTAKLAEMIGAEGVVQSQEGFGNPTTDLMQICGKLENKGIRTVLISNEDAGVDGKSEPLPDGTEEADAIVSTGNSNSSVILPPVDKVIGVLEAIEHVTGGFPGSILADGGLEVETHGIMGSHNLHGFTRLYAKEI